MQPIFEAGAEYWLDDCIWRENYREQYQYKLDLRKETDYTQLHAQLSQLALNIVYKYFEEWVYNGLDIETSWEDYLQELDDIGYNTMMEELDKVEPLESMILEYIK